MFNRGGFCNYLHCVKSVVLAAAFAVLGFVYAENYDARLQYVQSDGNQYYDKGLVLSDDVSYVMKFALAAAPSGTHGLFGSRTDASNRSIASQYGVAAIYADFNNAGGSSGYAGYRAETTVAPAVGTLYVITNSAASRIISNAETHTVIGENQVEWSGTFTTPGNAYIFSINQLPSGWLRAKVRLYSLTIKQGETVLRDYVPCLKDGVAQLFDTVTETFATNLGSGNLTAGPLRLTAGLLVTNSCATASSLSPAAGHYQPADGAVFKAFDGATAVTGSHCTGYIRETLDEDGLVLSSSSGDAATFTYSSASGAIQRLTWQWSNEVEVTVGAYSGGTVTLAGETFAGGTAKWVPATDGASVVLVATPAAGKVFSHWTGDVPTGHAKDFSLALALNQGRTVTPVFVDDPRATMAYNDFEKTMYLTVNYPTPAASITDFPVLVRLSTNLTGFDYSIFQTDDGADMAFFDEKGNVLPHEIDTWNTSGESLVWVKIPNLETNYFIKACFGSVTIQTQPDARKVWTGYDLVWHFSSATQADSTGCGLLPVLGTATSATDAFLGGKWVVKKNTSSPIVFPSPYPYLTDLTHFTLQTWIYNTVSGDGFNCTHMSTQTARTDADGFALYAGNNGLGIEVGGKGNDSLANSSYFAYGANVWTLMSAIIEGTTGGAYYGRVDGSGALLFSGSTTAVNAHVANGNPFVFGNLVDSEKSALSAWLSEVRFAKGVLSNARKNADCATVALSSFLTYGPVIDQDEVTISIGAYDGGTVTVNGTAVASGGSVNVPRDTYLTVVATPVAGGSFTTWSGDVTGTDAQTPSFSLRADTAKSFTPSFQRYGLANGGSYTTAAGGKDEVHTFYADGTFVVNHPLVADILLVGGGGGGGGAGYSGGGGGAGGFIYEQSVRLEATNYFVSVGKGGKAGGSTDGRDAGRYVASNGGDSFFAILTNGTAVGSLVTNDIFRAYGGGGAGGYGQGCLDAKSGASGGAPRLARANVAYYVKGQGYPGSYDVVGSMGGSGGGGGAGGPGTAISAAVAGSGGPGKRCDITGENLWYAGGGGGAAGDSATSTCYGGVGGSGIGGSGGSGRGTTASKSGTAPVAHTGSGGAGGNAGYYAGQTSGATGVIIVKARLVDSDDPTPQFEMVAPVTGAKHASFRGELFDAGADGLYPSADVYLSLDGGAYVRAQQGWKPGEQMTVNATGLASETTYAYSLLVSNAVCGVEAAKGSFTTLAVTGGAKPEIEIVSVATNNDLTADIAWNVTWAGTDADLTDVKILVGLAAEGPFDETLAATNTIGPGAYTLRNLTPGMHVYVALKAVNDQSVASDTTEIVDILVAGTLPTAKIGFDKATFLTADVAWRVSSIGAPAASAMAEVEYGTDPTFAGKASVTVKTDVTEPNTEGSLTLTGLEPNTLYYARTKVTTDMGASAYSSVVSFRTKDAPCEFSAVAFAAGTASTTVTRLDAGTTVSVTLLVNGNAVGNFSPSAVGTVLSQAVAVSGETTFDFSWQASCGGKNASGHVQATVSSAAMSIVAPATVADVEASLSGANVLKIGDVFHLPGSDEETVYKVDDNTTAQIDGRTITALKSGALAVWSYRIVHNDVAGHIFTTNAVSKVAMVVIPNAEDAPGGIWVTRNISSFTWTDSTKWTRISGTGDYPDGTGAWAILAPVLNYGSTETLTLPAGGVTVGGLITFDAGTTQRSNVGSYFSFTGGPFTFRQSAGKKAVWRLAGRKALGDEYDGYPGRVKFLASAPVTFASDADIDYMRGKSTATFFYDDLDIGANTVETVNGGGSMSPNYQVQQGLTIRKDLKGTGTFIHHANGQAGFDDMTSTPLSFKGTLVVGAGDYTVQRNSKHGGFLLDGALLPQATGLVLEGAWNGAYTKTPGVLFYTGSSGYAFWGTEYIDPLPHQWTLSGGLFNINAPGTGTVRTEYRADDFTIEGPSGQIQMDAPTAGIVTTVVQRVHAKTSLVRMLSYNGAKNVLRIATTPDEARDEDENDEFLPFLYAPGNWQYAGWYLRDKATGQVRVSMANRQDGLAADRHCMLYSSGVSPAETKIPENGMTIRSLQFGTGNGRCKIAFQQSGDVLKVKGGIVQLNNAAYIADPTNPNSAESVLDLGDKTGYMTTYSGYAVPVGCKIGANRLVLGGNGVLEYAGDSSATLSNGVYVTSGTLQLGSTRNETLYGAQLGKNDISVEAGAKLAIASEQPFRTSIDLKLGARDWLGAYGKVDLAPAETTVKRCSVNGTYLTRGTWGATGSGAKFIDDNHFSGPGVLKVRRDGNPDGLMLILR